MKLKFGKEIVTMGEMDRDIRVNGMAALRLMGLDQEKKYRIEESDLFS